MRIFDVETGKWVFRKERKRYDEIGQARELTFSCYHGYRFFERERTRRWFLEALQAARTKHLVLVWAYVIMPEHIHLLVCPKEEGPVISAFLRSLKEPIARQAIAYLGKHAPGWLDRITVAEGDRVRRRFWQPGGGYDRNVVEAATLLSMIEYIHANPVRRGLVKRPEDWEWSSARWYAGIRPVAIEMDPLHDFSGPAPIRRNHPR